MTKKSIMVTNHKFYQKCDLEPPITIVRPLFVTPISYFMRTNFISDRELGRNPKYNKAKFNSRSYDL